jgi:hypothetical protein
LLNLVASGCATITSSEMQSLALSTVDNDNKPVEGAACKLQNDKGSWEAKTPGFVSVRRSAEDLSVECSKDGQPNGILKAISRAAGGMFGNIVFGGGIGAIIDHTKGTGYNYPDALPVQMGKIKIVDRHGDTPQAPPDSAM